MRRLAFVLAVAVVLGTAVSTAQVADENQQREALKHYRAGEQLMYAESWDAAAQEFRQAIQLNPLMTIAHYGLGQVYMETKRYPEAIRAFTEARAAATRLATLAGSERAAAERMRDDQRRALQQALDQVRSGQAKVADPIREGLRLESRIHDLESTRHRDIDPLQAPPEISLSLGSAYFHTGALADAEREYRAAIQARPAFGEAHNNLAVVCMMTGRLDEAKDEVRRAEKAGFPVNPQFKKDLDRRSPGRVD
jgi:tetratricopeptide (TPR) repeat protein